MSQTNQTHIPNCEHSAKIRRRYKRIWHTVRGLMIVTACGAAGFISIPAGLIIAALSCPACFVEFRAAAQA